MNNISDHDSFKVIKILSVDDAVKQIPYGKALDNYLNDASKETQSLTNVDNKSSKDLSEKNLDELMNKLITLGFSTRLIPAIEFYINNSQQHFQLLERERLQDEKICYELSFEKGLDTNEYRLTGYEATLRIHPDIPDITIQGINAKELDKTMQTIDWAIDHHAESLFYESMKTQEGCELLDKVDSILKDINKLYENEGIGKDAAEKLMYKHWFSEPWESNTFSLDHVRQYYEWKKTVSINENPLQTKSETRSQLKEIALKDLGQLNKHSITNQSFVMNEQNVKYLKDNIKYLGFGEKLYPEMQSNMEQGLPEFRLKTQSEFNKDKIEAALHFKKSDTSDMYFLNRYDATLEKSNGEKLSQPFYLNKGNGVTIKEAYNLLHGRAVNKDLTNKEGEKYNAWMQLDLKNKNACGNYDVKQFHKNYGYDLEQSLAKFPIKELANGEQKDALIKSLQKGNIQSATFQNNGGEQKMYVEANPQLKTVNIYDNNMKLQQHETLKKNQSVEQLNGKDQKQNIMHDKKDKSQDKRQEIDQSKKNGKSVKQDKQDSLLPKKRTSQKKGLSLS